jgi:hypothetical protein
MVTCARTAVTGVIVLAALLAGCTDAAGPGPGATVGPTSAPTSAAATAPPPTRLAEPGCPVDDADVCRSALVAANALLSGDPAALRGVSAVETFTCDDMPAGIVPACRPGAVLRGHGLYSVASKISVVVPGDYPRWLDDLFGRVTPDFGDDRGPGRVVVLGVGTCGPADPQRRSYHLAFTAALTGPAGEPARRWLGSLEFVLREGRWVTALMYLDAVDAWRSEYRDPFREFACGNVRPWSAP